MTKSNQPLIERFDEIADPDVREGEKAISLAERLAPYLPGIDPDTLRDAFRNSGIPADQVLRDDEMEMLRAKKTADGRRITELEEKNAQLAKDALTDGLTGLPNERAFKKALKAEIMRMYRDKDEQIAILYMDIEDFKKINDTYGHDAGNRALQALAALLERFRREEEIAARLHGDEFVVVVHDKTTNPNFPKQAKKRLSDMIQEGLEIVATNKNTRRVERVTIGINIGHQTLKLKDLISITDPNTNRLIPEQLDRKITTLLDQADESMYKDKGRGKKSTRRRRRGTDVSAAHGADTIMGGEPT